MIGDKENKNKPAGADEVYPLIVYGILKGNIKKLKSNLNFIELFRHKTRLESEEEYYFTTISSALEFIENLSHIKLNIAEDVFARLTKESKEKQRKSKIIDLPYIKSTYYLTIKIQKILTKIMYFIILATVKMRKILITLN